MLAPAPGELLLAPVRELLELALDAVHLARPLGDLGLPGGQGATHVRVDVLRARAQLGVVRLPLVRLGEAGEPLQLGRGLLVLEEGALLLAQPVELGRDLLLEERGDLAHLLVLLGHGAERTLLALLKHTGAGRLLDHRERLGGLHVEHLGDLALHDQKVWVVDVQLHALEQVLHRLLRRLVPVDQVLGPATHGDLPRHGDGLVVFKRDGGALPVRIVKHDGDRGLGDARLPALVDQVLDVGRAHRAQVRDAQHETDRVEDITFPAPVQPGDGIEARVEPAHMRAHRVALEPIDDELLDPHRTPPRPPPPSWQVFISRGAAQAQSRARLP